jgi:membrane-associated phospholipid phosphatase
MAFFSWKVAAAIALVHGAATAFADPVPADRSPPTAPGSGPAGDTPTIAPPAPDAPPKKVEQAKEVAKSAELTPIVPSPNDALQPAFQLYAEIDPPILAVGTVFALARLTKTEPASCAPMCDAVHLNALDKITAGYYSAGWSTASDYLLYGLGAAGAGLLLADEGLLNTLNDSVVIGEATLSATGAASIMTLAAGRPRPFLYGDPAAPSGYKAPLSIRNSGDANLSFLSSHTAEAFAIVTSLYVAEHRLHPRSNYPKYILGAGLGVASLIGVARVMAGYHFITDVVGGAVVGTSLGVLVASVHGSPVHVVPVVNHESGGSAAGLAIRGSF